MLKRFLKKLGYSYRRIRKSLKPRQNPDEYEAKVKELQELVQLEKEKFLTVYFADESGFNEIPCVPYGWQPKDDPILLPTKKGKRCNVFGLMTRSNELHLYKKPKGTINSDFIIQSIDDFVINKCPNGRSVIVLDNAKVHHSEAFKAKIPEWKTHNVQIFYLPTYSPHLNLIETLWRKCKYEWLLPEHFESWNKLMNQLDFIFNTFGTNEYTIKFKEA